MTSVKKANLPGRHPRFRQTRTALIGLVAILVTVSPGALVGSAQQTDDEIESLTLTSYECSQVVPLDGAPIAEADCEGGADRMFSLSGPDGTRVDLKTSLEPTSEEVEYHQASWTADLDDEMVRGGTWELGEIDPSRGTVDLVSCLKAVGFKFAPAALEFRDDRSVRFDWDAAVRLSPSTVAGEYLECNWLTAPESSTGERPGLLTIMSAVGREPSDAALIVVEPGEEPQGFTNTEAGDVTSADFTLTSEESGQQLELETDDSSGDLSTTFALEAGEYTLTATSTGESASFTLDDGQTVLALNTLAERPALEVDPTPIVVELEPTEPPAPTPTVDAPPDIQEQQVFQFSASDWIGAYPDVVTAVYGRECVALYGVNSQYPSARVTFAADEASSGTSELVLTGLDDEWAAPVPIVVTVNGEVVYQGESGFENWNPNAAQVNWSQIAISFDSGLIVAGENEIVVTNLADAANFGIPPYVLLADASLYIGASAG